MSSSTEAQEEAARYYPGFIAQQDPERLAVIMGESGETMTFGQLDAMANRVSHYFASLGLTRGDHVALCMENRLEYLPLVWGAHYAGLYYTAISSRLTAEEISYILNDCTAQAFVTSPYKAEAAAEIIATTPGVKARVTVGGPMADHDDFADIIAECSDHPLPDRLESTDMLYSSGTTGRPKGIKNALPDEPLGTAPALVMLTEALLGLTDGCVYLSPAPLYHAAPLRFCLAAHRVGGTVVVMEHFDAETALALIERYQVTASQWVPTMFVRMLKLPDATRQRYDVSSLGHAVHAAAPCPVEVKQRMIDWWGPVLHEYYAGTEGNGFCYLNSEEWLAHRGSVGRALVGEVHIVDDDGNELPVGEEGGVYFSGGGSFEYHNDPDKTAGSHMANGWSTLGDVGRVDEDGYLYLTDRKAFMIISGGVNIYPQEAENTLTMHPEVADVAVFGVPNADFGEEVKAVVQPVTMPEDQAAADQLARTLIAYCREHLADIKCPRSIDFRPELPRHPTGKLYKRLLKAEYWPTD